MSVYVCTAALPDFLANVFPRLPDSCPPFVLVTGDADELAPTDNISSLGAATELLNSPLILAWFAQNCIATHPKLTPLPIGLDYHTIASGAIPWWGPRQTPAEQEADLLSLRRSDVKAAIPYVAYSNFHFNLMGRFCHDRLIAMKSIAADCVYYEPQRTTRWQSWQRQRFQHRFVLSPHGNGLDCHRTWEALCLGRIPIVRTSPLDCLWEGLPVWVVREWSEVTAKSMVRKAAELDSVEKSSNSADSIPEKLLLKYWVDRIRNAGATSS